MKALLARIAACVIVIPEFMRDRRNNPQLPRLT